MDGDSKELYNLIRSDIVRIEAEIKALGIVVAGFNEAGQKVAIDGFQRLATLEVKVASHDKLFWMFGSALIAIATGVIVNILRIWFAF